MKRNQTRAPLSAEEQLQKRLTDAFNMPSPPTMVSRKSTLTNAFVCAILPVVMPSTDEIEQALRILHMEPDNLRCAYCGDPSSEWDHLFPLVKSRRPTGYISEIGNLVPACGRCNSSKGNADWELWMRSSTAKNSPFRRGVLDLDSKIERLRNYTAWRPARRIDFETLVGKEAWESYWRKLDTVDQMLVDCQSAAVELEQRIDAAMR